MGSITIVVQKLRDDFCSMSVCYVLEVPSGYTGYSKKLYQLSSSLQALVLYNIFSNEKDNEGQFGYYFISYHETMAYVTT